jgi:DNA ligase D-like protein (predicted ligase)
MTASVVTRRINSLPTRTATFVEPMECLAVTKLPEGSQWLYEIKLDGYRAIGIKADDGVQLLSRRKKSFNRQFATLPAALCELPENTVVDGEIVALDEQGRPNFTLIQHSRSSASRICYFIFDLLIHKGHDLTRLPLLERRQIMSSELNFRLPRIRIADYFETHAADMISAVRAQGLEGVVAKRKEGLYEAGQRTGSWAKYRLNRGQELVIGGYIPGLRGVDAIIIGYYKANDLIYVARVRAGFVPATRRLVFERLRILRIPDCPFVNLPETAPSRWGEGLTGEDIEKCVWVRPELVAQIEFLEWTEGDHLRHSKFVRLRDDKDARSITKEHAGEA